MAGKSEQIRIDLTAQDNASRVIDKVADAAEDLEKLDPEVEVTADASRAEADVKSLADDVEQLSRADAEILLRAKVDAARGELKALQGELKQTGDVAQTTARELDRVDSGGSGGGGARGNAIADLTGPLGDASGAASDFAGVMDGLDDIMGDVLGKMGASAGTIATMSGAMGGLGVAVAVGAAAWSYFGAQQKKAAEEAQKTADATREINEALEEGRIDEAAAKIVEGYGDVLKAAEEAGLGVKEATDFITGASDAVPGFAGRLAELNAAAEASRDTLTGQLNPELANAAAAFENVGFKLDDAKAKFADGNLTIAEQDRLLAEVGAALGDHATDVDKAARAQDRMKASGERLRGQLDRIRGGLDVEQAALNFTSAIQTALDATDGSAQATEEEILAVKQAILDLGVTAETNPAIIQSQIDQVDAYDLNTVKANVEAYYARNPAKITAVLGTVRRPPGYGGDPGAPIPMMAPDPGTGGAPATTINVTQYVPRGWRGDALVDAERAARRSGGLYRRTRR